MSHAVNSYFWRENIESPGLILTFESLQTSRPPVPQVSGAMEGESCESMPIQRALSNPSLLCLVPVVNNTGVKLLGSQYISQVAELI